ncbi:Uncharacterised protein [Shigella sonnei]|nr:Uncharacterised protein [Shigella sonnei]
MPNAFALTRRMDCNPADPPSAQCRRQWIAAVRRQRLGHQITPRATKTCPYRLTEFLR